MTRRVFFSFHYERDIWRVNQVRHSWITQGNRAAGYIDAAEFEQIRNRGGTAIKHWIDQQLHRTSVTAVLVGQETADRNYVQYEIAQSVKRGNGLVAVRIHKLKNQKDRKDWEGDNPLEDFNLEGDRPWFFWKSLADKFKIYNWHTDDGFSNFGDWVEEAHGIAKGSCQGR